jgi:large repetitive protein
MKLDGQIVASTYITGTGQLIYLPSTPLVNGQHAIMVSATDVVGNAAVATATFTVDVHYPLYLPLISK